MNFRTLVKGVSCALLLLTLSVGFALPHSAIAQEDNSGLLGGLNDPTAPNGSTPSGPTLGDLWNSFFNNGGSTNNSQTQTGGGSPTGNGGGWTGWLQNLFGNNSANTTETNTSSSNPSSWFSFFGFGGATNGSSNTTAQTEGNAGSSGGSGFLSFGGWFGNSNNNGTANSDATNGSDGSIVGNLWNVLDAVGGVFSDNPVTNTVVNGGEAVIAEIITGITNAFTGDVTTDSTQLQLTEDLIYNSPYYEFNADGTITEYDSEGQEIRTYDPNQEQPSSSNSQGQGQGGGTSGHHPSGLGGLGSPSNPLTGGDNSEVDTDGSNSDATGTNNVDTQTSPYLFEPVPGGENNAGHHTN